MRIAYITAGAAGMYCGSCLHDNTLAARLLEMGHDVALIPTYTPIRTDETDVSISRVFYGAVNVYLEQKSSLFRHTPWLVDRMLDNRKLLDWVSSRSSSVDARELGELTLSVLMGQDGHQRKELDKLVDWLGSDLKPELVHLTNSMFLGLARRIKEALAVPVVCSVQGEDIFLEELEEPHRSRVQRTIRDRAGDVDGFVAPSRYYVGKMASYLDVPPQRIEHVPLGIKLDGFDEPRSARDDGTFVIGYLARVCPEKGLHVLVDAFREVCERLGRDRVRLRVAGYNGERDRAYLSGIQQQLQSWGLDDRVDLVGEVDRAQKAEFLRSLDVLSVPTTYVEPKGLFVLEALACGVPVVQPRHGAFPELIDATGGGVLVEPGSPPALATAFVELAGDPERAAALGAAGREATHRLYGDRAMAETTLRYYERLLGEKRRPARSATGDGGA